MTESTRSDIKPVVMVIAPIKRQLTFLLIEMDLVWAIRDTDIKTKKHIARKALVPDNTLLITKSSVSH